MQIAQGEFIYVNEDTMWAFSHKSYKVRKHTLTFQVRQYRGSLENEKKNADNLNDT